MRLVFIGASKFGLRCLQAAHQLSDVEVVGIITNAETFKISYAPEKGVKNVLHENLVPFAEEHQIPIHVMQNKMTDPDLLETITAWAPDFILVSGWYHMVPKAIRDLAPVGGLHSSLLPDYSGGAPLVWAIMNGETKTGISFFLMDAGVDSGPLIGQKAEPIFPDDTIGTLYARIEERGLELLNEYLPQIANGSIQYQVQDESKRRIFPQRSPDDGLINWQLPASELYNFIRAQTKPYPGAYTTFNNEKLTIWKAEVLNSEVTPSSSSFEKHAQAERQGQTIVQTCGNDTSLNIQELHYKGQDYTAAEFIAAFGPLPQFISVQPQLQVQ